MIAADSGDKNIVQPIVVVITDRYAHPVEAHIQPGPGSHIGKMTLAVVVAQHGRGWLFAFRNVPGPVGRVDKQEILVSVVIEVEKGDTAAHGFRQELFTVRTAVV